jgi:hypothetical protein
MSAAATVLTARESIFHFFRGLPIMALINLILLGSFQGNLNYIFFAAGMSFFAPLSAVLVNMFFEYLISLLKSQNILYIGGILLLIIAGSGTLIGVGSTDGIKTEYLLPGIFTLVLTLFVSIYAAYASDDDSLWSIKNGASCTLFETVSETPLSSMNSIPSTWTVMTTFFFVYLIFNAFDIYNRQVPKSADPIAVNARKTRTGVSIFILILMLIFVLAGRYIVTNCETFLGLVIGIILGIYTGYIWYTFLRSCGMGQFDDIFGISNRLLSREAAGNATPNVCLPVISQ